MYWQLKGNSNGPLNHGKEGKTMNYGIQCRFSEFLIQLFIKKKMGPCRNITTMCRNITDQEPGAPGVSCTAVLGVCEEILIFRRNIHLCNILSSDIRYHVGFKKAILKIHSFF